MDARGEGDDIPYRFRFPLKEKLVGVRENEIVELSTSNGLSG
jgi:hypothetical protein